LKQPAAGRPATPIAVLRDGKTLDLTVTPKWPEDKPSEEDLPRIPASTGHHRNRARYRAVADLCRQGPAGLARERAGITKATVITA